MHSSRMRTSRLLTLSRNVPCISEGGSAQHPLDADPSPLWRQTPRVADPLDTGPPPPGCRPPTLEADPPPWMQTPHHGCRPPWRQTPWSRDL